MNPPNSNTNPTETTETETLQSLHSKVLQIKAILQANPCEVMGNPSPETLNLIQDSIAQAQTLVSKQPSKEKKGDIER